MGKSRYVWRCRDRLLLIESRALIMGIVNVTPDSFSDGGRHAGCDAAVAHALRLVEQGADLLDIGGESTRPGAVPVPLEEELQRIIPVIRELAARTSTPLSIDTMKAEVARQALAAGAHIVNDVTALQGDADMAAVVQSFGAGVVLMHMQGTPQTMQVNPTYIDVVAEVAAFLQTRLQALANAGIAAEQAVLDPGFGFGKTRLHNLQLLAHLDALQSLRRPVCLGVSRKGIFGSLLGRPVEQRLAGSLAAVGYALGRKAAQIVRVHDVAETRDVVRVFEALQDLVDEESLS
jgi:dihydropteroate synthase